MTDPNNDPTVEPYDLGYPMMAPESRDTAKPISVAEAFKWLESLDEFDAIFSAECKDADIRGKMDIVKKLRVTKTVLGDKTLIQLAVNFPGKDLVAHIPIDDSTPLLLGVTGRTLFVADEVKLSKRVTYETAETLCAAPS